jgi:hypothetical protein
MLSAMQDASMAADEEGGKQMNQADKEMKHLVEQAGWCWHELFAVDSMRHNSAGYRCNICGALVPRDPNPNPHSVDSLLEIADKLDYHDILFSRCLASPPMFCRVSNDNPWVIGQGETKADALRFALYQATGGE